MSQVPDYIAAFQKLTPFYLKEKSKSRWQRLLGAMVAWYIPGYLTHYVTIIGKTIYLPSQHQMDHPSAIFTIAHEVVHLLDQKRLSFPVFVAVYLFPQIFTVGILSFPWIGWWAMFFLIFLLPWPSIGRVYLESRAYGLEQYLIQRVMHEHQPMDKVASIFTSWDYYKMSWSTRCAKKWINHYFTQARNGTDQVFVEVIRVFDSVVTKK